MRQDSGLKRCSKGALGIAKVLCTDVWVYVALRGHVGLGPPRCFPGACLHELNKNTCVLVCTYTRTGSCPAPRLTQRFGVSCPRQERGWCLVVENICLIWLVHNPIITDVIFLPLFGKRFPDSTHDHSEPCSSSQYQEDPRTLRSPSRQIASHKL